MARAVKQLTGINQVAIKGYLEEWATSSNFILKLLGGRVADTREACRLCLVNSKLYAL